jgi:hypothetical protein
MATTTIDQYNVATQAFNEAKAILDILNQNIQTILYSNKITKTDVETMKAGFQNFFEKIVTINGVDDLIILKEKQDGGKNKKDKKQKGGDELADRLAAATKALTEIRSIVNDLGKGLKGSWSEIKVNLENWNNLLNNPTNGVFFSLSKAVGDELSLSGISSVATENNSLQSEGGKSKNKNNKKNQRGGMYAAAISNDQYSNTSGLLSGALDPYAQATAFNASIYAPQAFNAGLGLSNYSADQLPSQYTNVMAPQVTTRQLTGGNNRKNKNKKQQGGDLSVPAYDPLSGGINMPVNPNQGSYSIISNPGPSMVQQGGRRNSNKKDDKNKNNDKK